MLLCSIQASEARVLQQTEPSVGYQNPNPKTGDSVHSELHIGGLGAVHGWMWGGLGGRRGAPVFLIVVINVILHAFDFVLR